MAAHYYIWYRVPGDPAAARGAVNALMQEISLHTGVVGRLLMRTDSPPTWLEVYESVVDATLFEDVYMQAVGKSGVEAHAPDGRRIERFWDAP